MRYRQLLRSILGGDVVLRLAAIVLPVILGRALLSGLSGWWAVVVVVAAAATLWGVLWMVGRVRTLMAQPATEAPDARPAPFPVGRSRSRQVAALRLPSDPWPGSPAPA